MLPGPDQIIECPECKALAKVSTLASGNTFGARWWTDGKVDAPMLPEQPAITKCTACGDFYWLSDANVVGECFDGYIYERSGFEPSEQEKIPDDWDKAGWIGALTEEELVEAIAAGAAHSREQELYLRIRLWWATNEPFRDREGDDPDQVLLLRSAVGTTNLERLLNLLNLEEPDEQIMKAEVARELGRFDEALLILESGVSPELEDVAALIRKFAQEGDSMVKEVVN